MNKEKIYYDFLNLNFNRITKKQKSKTRAYIISFLEGMYKMESNPKFYKFLGIIPFKRCYNLESYSPNYEILLTAHYDTHIFRQNYIQSFISRKVQNNILISILFYLFWFLMLFLLPFILYVYFKANIICSFFIASILSILCVVGLPVFVRNKTNPFSSAPIYDDNSSGIVAVLHIASLLHKNGYNDKIKLLFIDCEEIDRLGSRLFVKSNLEDLQNKIIINLDCVGRGSNIFITSKDNSKLAKDLQCFLLSKNINTTLSTKSYSDDKIFQNKNLNAIGISRGDKDPKGDKLLHWTHTSHDTLENINLDYITEIVETMTEFIIQNL